MTVTDESDAKYDYVKIAITQNMIMTADEIDNNDDQEAHTMTQRMIGMTITVAVGYFY